MKTTHYFNTGVRPYSFADYKLSAGHIERGGTVQIPFTCEDVPKGAAFMFACDHADLRETSQLGVIVKPILPGSAILSKNAYFRIQS